jgi:small-conductance mechanosensitive channel
MPIAQADTGYLYELLVEMGLNDFQARTLEFLLVRPLRLAAIAAVALVLSRLGSRWVRRAVHSVHMRAPQPLRSERMEQRAATMAEVVAKAWRGVVWGVAVLVILDEVGIDLAPLLAGAGIAGIAFGFGAQSLVKDFISGLFILLEDQYGVGDVVALSGDARGTVEDVSLRVTRVRALDGTVWYVPNGDIRQVGNRSMGWSRALVDVPVPVGIDPEAAAVAIREAAQSLAGDSAWEADVTGDAEVWGVEEMTADAVVLRVALRTAPRRQWAVARELRRRVDERFRREGWRGGTA